MSKEKKQRNIENLPTFYQFNLIDVPLDKYVETLNVLFRDPDYKEKTAKRNRIVQSVARMRPGSSEAVNAVKIIQQYDRKLADVLFAAIVQANLHSDHTYDCLSFGTCLRYFVDYTRENMQEKVDRLSRDLNKLTFLSDMLENILIDVRSEMDDIFQGEIKFQQFDAVEQCLKQLRGFFQSARPQDLEKPESQLFIDYADSINAYMEKRLKTFGEKYAKYHPMPNGYKDDDMVKAINQFFGTEHKFGHQFINHTPLGGIYIDAMRLVPNLDPIETEKLDRLVGQISKSPDAIDKYSFQVTDVIMEAYQPHLIPKSHG